MNGDLATLDSEYNKLAQILAEGERDNFNQGWLTSKLVRWRYKLMGCMSQSARTSNKSFHPPWAPSIPGGLQRPNKPWKIPPSCASATSFENFTTLISNSHVQIYPDTCTLYMAFPCAGAPKWRPMKPRFGQRLKAQNQKKSSKAAVHHSPRESRRGSRSECIPLLKVSSYKQENQEHVNYPNQFCSFPGAPSDTSRRRRLSRRMNNEPKP